jgi:hypothetical protein
MLSDKARSLLRDFMLVFDLNDFFKGSTEVTESDAAKTLEYIKSVFEQANLLAPTTYMTSDGLLKHLKSLRNTNQKFKKAGSTLQRTSSSRACSTFAISTPPTASYRRSSRRRGSRLPRTSCRRAL